MKIIKYQAYDPDRKKIFEVYCFNQEDRFAEIWQNKEKKATLIYHCENFDKLKFREFTGLKDKNGKEVYGGDIFKIEDRFVEVRWYKVLASWDTRFLKLIPGVVERFESLKNSEWQYRAEVIGNLYENPELAKA